VFPVRYELDFYIKLLRNSVFKGLIAIKTLAVIPDMAKY
jgi:hypothetical protein